MNNRNILDGTEEQHLILYPARFILLILLAAVLLFGSGGIWMWPVLNSDGLLGIGAFVSYAGLFVFLFYVGLIQLIKPDPLLVVDNVGFHKRTRSGKDQFIAWDEIALIFSSRERNHFILNVCVSEAGMETLSIRYPKPERILPLVDSKMAIDFSLSNVSEQKLIDSIKNKYQRQIKQNNILVYLFKSA